ncbi:MAG: gamma-glutamyl-gamma-aminobutyrate hydrolase family protein [Planctomycetes bacterium]|nr:gamma-glutamyl-gamma-aminobutyrate hydrolase family protein [Planctomycetota bacterium]
MTKPRIARAEGAGHGGPAHKGETCGRGLRPPRIGLSHKEETRGRGLRPPRIGLSHKEETRGRGLRPPRIGLNCDLTAASGTEIAKVNWNYAASVLDAGGLPLLFPPVEESSVADLLDIVDGLVLTGGRDYDPAVYGEPRHPATELLDPRRAAFDVALARAALARGLPILGICGGAQLVNIALGGTLIQHVPDAFGTAINHTWGAGAEPFHEVDIEADSRLAAIIGAGRLRVNSSHHQAVGRLGNGLRIVARAPDGVVEAIEGTGNCFLLGVQWHPERMPSRPDQMALFSALVRAANGPARTST